MWKKSFLTGCFFTSIIGLLFAFAYLTNSQLVAAIEFEFFFIAIAL